MSSVGTYLRELRQRKGVSLEEIARTTRVAQRYLESIEADAFDALPSPVFTRGFIRAYCQALSEPPEEALAAYEDREVTAPAPAASPRPGMPPATRPAASAARPGAPTTRPAPATTRPAPATARPAPADGEARGRGAVLVSFVLLVVLGVALFAVALVIHPRERGERVVVSEPKPETRPVRPPGEPAPVPAPVVTPPPAPTSGPPAAAPAAGQPAASAPRPAAPAAPAPSAAAPPAAVPGATPAAAATSTSAGPGAPPPTSPRPATVPAAPPAAATPPAPAAATPPGAAVPGLEAAMSSVTSPYRLVARTSETTWIRVRTEDGRTSEENVPAGEIREWISNRPFTLTVGNAGGVSLELNGRALPPLGPKGAVIPRIVLPPDAR